MPVGVGSRPKEVSWTPFGLKDLGKKTWEVRGLEGSGNSLPCYGK